MVARLTTQALEALYKSRGWPIYGNGYDLNLFGIREAGASADVWDDTLGVFYTTDAGRRVLEVWDGTTAPGVAGLRQPQNVHGTAILAPGYHRHAWRLGKHKGAYPCLVQASPLPVFRDGDRDAQLDAVGELDMGWHALQIHHADGALRVGRYSLGCQATRWPADLARLLALLDLQELHGHGPTLSYGLVTSAELAPFLHAMAA